MNGLSVSRFGSGMYSSTTRKQFLDRGVFGGVRVGRGAFQGLLGGAAHDRGGVAGEAVAAEQFAQFEFHEFEQFGVIHHVDLVQEDDDGGHFHLASQEDVFAGLRHRTIGGCHDEDGSIDLGRTGDHVLDVVTVSRHVDVRVVALVGLVLDVRDVDRDATRFFFRGIVDLVVGFEICLSRQSGYLS
jgi:hypothetical protein